MTTTWDSGLVSSSASLDTTTASSTQFWYDDNQNRIKMITQSGGVYYFVYDPTASIPAVVYEQGPSYRYLNIREPGGSLVARERYTSGGTMDQSRTYHFDALGSTTALTDQNGNVTDTYAYDAWGKVHPGASNTTTDNPYQYVGALGYYKHYQELDFGLLQLGVRYYDPTIGRFTQRDREQVLEESLFLYVGAHPTGAMDPEGNKWRIIWPFPPVILPFPDPGDPKGPYKPVPKGCANGLKSWADRNITSRRYGKDFDKVKHCYVSCKLIRDCNMNSCSVEMMGWLKEVWDALGHGSPDIDDLRGDYTGIDLASRKGADCLRDCVKELKKKGFDVD